MSKHKNTFDKMRRKPPPSDLKWSDLVSAMRHIGYEVLNGSGSRRKFYNKDLDLLISCHEPHPSPNVDKGCVVDILDHLHEHDLI
ncbi:type II toxin-antitoxin system HicA family toxin [Silvimonas soli]|uniref:type II toxin-antitoxin system HicA family toxin n=1 Tax=Silvimonas soli TaxID=2980100 RepID=UPI0036F1AE06